MLRFVIGRLVQAAAALLVLSVIVFLMSRATGNPLDMLLSPYATKADYASLNHALGFDKPLPVQYLIFLSNALHGDLGKSVTSGQSVSQILADRFGASAMLGLLSIVISLAVGVPFGVLSAVNRGRPIDAVVRLVALFGQSVPLFWAGALLIQIFSVNLGWLPAGTSGRPTDIILPAITLSLFGIASISRLLRSSMLEVLDSESIKLARSKGISEMSVIWKHALKNALLPVISFAGVFIVNLVTLAVVVETVFAWPGVGLLSYSSIISRDFPIIQGVVLLAGAVSILMSTLTDILYVYIDPRIRYAPG
jgi:peptide/nickel transport system permease protein